MFRSAQRFKGLFDSYQRLLARTYLSIHWKGLVALLFLFVWLILNWIGTIHKVVQYYSPLPAGDYWRVVEDLQGFKDFDLSVFWRQHNEHRIVFPEMIFAIDMLCLGGRQVLPTILNVSLYFGVWMIVAGATLQERSVSLPIRIWAAVLAGIVMGWPLNSFVLGTPFLLQWTLVQSTAVLGLAALFRARNAASPFWVSLVICCGVVATFSSANGMLLWPVLIGASLLLRMPKKRLATLVTAAIISILVFFIGYRTPGHLDILAILEHPIHYLGFIISYVSMPFGVLKNPVIGFVFGSISLLGWIGLAIHAARRPATLSPVCRSIFFGYYAFVLLTALSTAIGRMDLQDAGFYAAKAGRYVTLPLAAWAALTGAAILVSPKDHRRMFSRQAIAAVAVVALLFMQVRLARWLRTQDRFSAGQQLAALSLRNDILDSSILGYIFPNPSFVERYLPELRTYKLSIYADRFQAPVGRPVHSLFSRTAEPTLKGKILRVMPVQEGVEVVASTCCRKATENCNLLLFVDEQGLISGFGLRTSQTLSKILSPDFVHGRTNWAGFIHTHAGASRFSMFLLDARQCRLVPLTPTLAIPD